MSYVSQQFLLSDNSSLANFKNWAQAISTAFSTSGWTQTSDTGQVNWGTIVSVPTSGNFVYEIWQPADALQTGSTKYFVKIKYGTSSGSPAAPRLQIQSGSATDGAGNLTGITTTNWEVTAGNNAGQGSILTFDCYFSGDTNRFHMMMWRSINSFVPMVVSIERTKNTDGTDSSDGWNLVVLAQNSGNAQRNETGVFGVGLATAVSNRQYPCIQGGQSSGVFNNNIPVSPLFPIYGKVGNPLTGIAFVCPSDVAEGCIFTTTLYGATRTYIATGFCNLASPSGYKTCMRFD